MKSIRDSNKIALFPYEHHCWKYDDGGFIYGLYHTEKKEFKKTKAVCKKEELKEHIRFVEKELDEKGRRYSSVPKKHKMHVGTLFKREDWYDRLVSGESCMEKLEALLTAYASNGSIQEVVRLFSLVLAGYISRQFLKHAATISAVFNRAPIVNVIPQKTFYGGYPQLEYLFRAFAVDTAADCDLEVHTPAVLPGSRDDRKLIDGAYIQIIGDKKEKRFPAQYRDQSVLVHTHFFAGRDIREFVNRNRWAAVFLFGKKQPKDFLGVVTLDANKICFPEVKPETEEVRCLIRRFVQWLAEEKEDLKHWVQLWENAARDDIHRFILASVSTGANMQIEEEMMVLQLAAIHAFLSFCAWKEAIDKEKCTSLLEKLGNALLPGSQTEETIKRSMEAEAAEQERARAANRAALEKLLGSIIREDDMSKVVYVPKRGEFQNTTKVDLEKEPWAALSYKNGKGAKILKISMDYLQALTEHFKISTWNQISEYIGQIKDKTVTLDYFDRADTANLRIAGNSNTYTAITLFAERLDFLTQEEQNLLLQKYPPQE